ncbi:MAG: hypothetical protein IPL01_18425 [Acidobacteria bacterium]|nr:hypothetical protein [Acidobacteriota bacterium]
MTTLSAEMWADSATAACALLILYMTSAVAAGGLDSTCGDCSGHLWIMCGSGLLSMSLPGGWMTDVTC